MQPDPNGSHNTRFKKEQHEMHLIARNQLSEQTLLSTLSRYYNCNKTCHERCKSFDQVVAALYGKPFSLLIRIADISNSIIDIFNEQSVASIILPTYITARDRLQL
jgi:hypothetical protein